MLWVLFLLSTVLLSVAVDNGQALLWSEPVALKPSVPGNSTGTALKPSDPGNSTGVPVCEKYTQDIPIWDCTKDTSYHEYGQAVYCSNSNGPCSGLPSSIQSNCLPKYATIPLKNGGTSCPFPVDCQCVIDQISFAKYYMNVTKPVNSTAKSVAK